MQIPNYPPRSPERGRELIELVSATAAKAKAKATFGAVTEEGHGYSVPITTDETPARILSWFERCDLLMMTLDTMESPYVVTFRETHE